MDLDIIPRDINGQYRFTIVEYRHRIINLYAQCNKCKHLFQTIQVPAGLSGDTKSEIMPYHIPKGSEERFFKSYCSNLQFQLSSLWQEFIKSSGNAKPPFNFDCCLYWIDEDPGHTLIKVSLEETLRTFNKELTCIDLTKTHSDHDKVLI